MYLYETDYIYVLHCDISLKKEPTFVPLEGSFCGIQIFYAPLKKKEMCRKWLYFGTLLNM